MSGLSQPAATPYEVANDGVHAAIVKAVARAEGEEEPDGTWVFPSEAVSSIARIAADAIAPLLAEAERRGAENGWDEGSLMHWIHPADRESVRNRNPYRKEA